MATLDVFNLKREKVGTLDLSDEVFGAEVREHLFYEVVKAQLASRRQGTATAKNRSAVSGSTKKLFRQKGTGTARAGAKRTNKRKGGGVAFARRNRDYRYALPKQAVRSAVRMALLSKFEDKQVLDAALIASAQAVEHYEMTRYGTLIAWARQLGRSDCANVLADNLKEEVATDRKLTEMAESRINLQAAE